jgi:hypothetical protein
MFIMLWLATSRATATETPGLQLTQLGNQKTAFNATDEKKRGNATVLLCLSALSIDDMDRGVVDFSPGALVQFYSKEGIPLTCHYLSPQYGECCYQAAGDPD